MPAAETVSMAPSSPDDDSRRTDLGVLVDLLREDGLQARRRGNSGPYPKRDGLRDVGSCAVACPLHRIDAQPLEEIVMILAATNPRVRSEM